MANFLSMCRKVHLLLRIGEEAPGTQPATVTGQAGVVGEMVEWVRNAHNDLCLLHPDWRFMQADGSFDLPAGGRIVTLSALQTLHADFGRLMPLVEDNNAFLTILPTGVADAAEQYVYYVPPQDFHGHWDIAPLPTGQPTHFTITAEGGIELDAIADREYTLRYRYRRAVVELSADADLPMFDSDYHDTIVYWAITRYYCLSRDGVKALHQKSNAELVRELTKLRNEQLPDFTVY